MARPLYPIPDRHGNYTPEQIRECERVTAGLKQEALYRKAYWRGVRMTIAEILFWWAGTLLFLWALETITVLLGA